MPSGGTSSPFDEHYDFSDDWPPWYVSEDDYEAASDLWSTDRALDLPVPHGLADLLWWGQRLLDYDNPWSRETIIRMDPITVIGTRPADLDLPIGVFNPWDWYEPDTPWADVFVEPPDFPEGEGPPPPVEDPAPPLQEDDGEPEPGGAARRPEGSGGFAWGVIYERNRRRWP